MQAAKILVVDDNLVNRRLLEIWLTRQGHSVVCVGDGQAALDAMSRSELGFDLVFMDCHMPILDGCAATRRYRAWEAEQATAIRLPILALTAGDASGEEECMASGMDGYLTKPLDFGRISALMSRFLPA